MYKLSPSRVRILSGALIGLFLGAALNAQNPKDTEDRSISFTNKSTTVETAVREVAKQAGKKIFFSNGQDKGLKQRVSVQLSKVSLSEALARILGNTGLVSTITPDGSTIVINSANDSSRKSSTSQDGILTGIITDSATGLALAGVSISIPGTGIATISRADGRYTLPGIPVGKQIVVAKMLGYRTSSITLDVSADEKEAVNIRMTAVAAALSEVVTTATGAQRRVEVPTDIVKISADEIRERAPVRNVIDLIEAAQVPGVLVTRAGGDPGAPSRIRIRGLGSISQSNDPVMIIDGAWIDASVSKPSRFDDLDPAAIETIEIVRGPSAATLYGQDAANGVIVITTKKGKAGPTRWNFSYNRDWGQTYGRQPLFYAGVGQSPALNRPMWCSIARVLDYTCTQDSVVIMDPNNKLVSREGVETRNKYTAQMDGGAGNTTYSVTFSTENTIGVRRTAEVDLIRFRRVGYKAAPEFVTPSELRRNNVTTVLTFTPRENLSLGMTLVAGQTSLKDNSLSTIWAGINGLAPAQFSIDTTFSATDGANVSANEGPVATSTGTLSGTLQYRPMNIAVVNGNFGAEKTNRTESSFIRKTYCMATGCTDQPGERAEAAATKSVYTIRMNASTSLNLGRFSRFLDIRPSVGGDFRKTDDYAVSIAKRDVPIGDRSINSGTLNSSINTTVENAIAGWFLNSTIGLFQRVYFDVGVRQDIGSAITSSNDAIYPKIGGSWLVSDEPFWRHNSLINSLRLRSAIGHAAVQPDPGDINGKFTQGMEYIDGKFVNTSDFAGTGNSALRPERSVELELGFDLDMLSDRLNLVGTYAHKVNRNTLVVRTLPPSFGSMSTATRKENVAKVQNRNLELSAIGRVIENQTARLALNYTLTLSDNKVITLGDGIAPFNIREARIAAGYPLAGAWGREVLGYYDANQDGLLSENEVILSDSVAYFGWSQPRYRAGYGITLTLLNQFVFDSRIAYQSRYLQSYTPKFGPGQEDVNASLQEQAVAVMSNINKQKPISDVRWNSASITYHVPNSVLRGFGRRNVSVSLQGSNLGLWTNYVGRDPGINSELLNGDAFGDNGKTPPRPRLFVLDFKIGL